MPNHEVFPRRRLVKESLFNANARPVDGREGAWACAADLVGMLRLPAGKKDCQNFYNFIFAPITSVEN